MLTELDVSVLTMYVVYDILVKSFVLSVESQKGTNAAPKMFC